jgi:N-acetylglutamate synthase-like GNAT family acetyltransferase
MSTTADTSLANSLSIRRVTSGDVEAVFELLQQLALGYASDRVAFDTTFDELVDSNSAGDDKFASFIVAEDAAGRVLGYALTTVSPLLHTAGSSAQLEELVVDVGSRGQGIGTRLVESVEQTCRERNVKQLTVATRRDADFYARLGYRSTADLLKRTFD